MTTKITKACLALLLAGTAVPAFAAAPMTKVDVSLGDVSLNKVPFIIAADAGIYAKNGLDVHQFVTANAARAVEPDGIHTPKEMIGDNMPPAPINSGGGAPMVSGAAHPGANYMPRVIVMSQENIVRNHILLAPGSAIKSPQDLKGKKIGIAGLGAVPGFAAIMYTKQLGWDYKTDVTLVQQGDNIEALKTGKADAGMGSAFVNAMAADAGLKDMIDLSQYKIPEAGSGVTVDAKWLVGNRDTVAKFVKATVEATALMKKDRKQFGASLAKWFGMTDPKVADYLFAEAKSMPDKPYPAVEGIKAAMVVNDSPDMQKHKAEDFYDSSFVAALDKSGYLDKLTK